MELTLSSSSSFPLVISRLAYPSTLSSKTNSLVSMKARNSSRRSKPLTCNAFFGLGVPELVVIAGVSVLAFGPKNLPQFASFIGKTIKSFQQAAKEFESEIKKETDSIEENPTAVIDQEGQETKVSSTKDSV